MSKEPSAAVANPDPLPRIGLRVGLETTSPGRVEWRPQIDHRLKIHAGAPVAASCDTGRFLYTRGDVDIFPAGSSDACDEHGVFTSLVVHLSPSLLQRAAEDMGLDPGRAGLEPRYQFRDPQLEHIAWALDAERTAGHPSGRLYAESLGIALAVRLLGHYRTAGKVERGLSAPQLRRLRRFIDDHLDQDLSLARLAQVADLSASHLKTLFKRSTGVPVHEYVIQRRVERAKRLLMQSDLPVSQVAFEAGFAHQSHMARSMRRVLGVTPASIARRSGGAGDEGVAGFVIASSAE